ncbi:hypothetical protein BOW37_01675 [Solemya velum gill symbiont]|uniref:helix-turn-helix transcriptional regulator n=1 Tax=Solemya velum gill symbiont TaxID=2340 RepID=UPI000996737E|nr:hypothetical protein [Solemya velum gill symbiont]OOZ45827.1 hypothetical protein BOW37_01675 [Solemya velum gill symbiont]OOZ50758.1 hypothetical protein BOW39_00970 [Solemya velum gill symbiont]OOZ57036.1 hypothetical protein BOW42_03870 [Solemya velum gill symbiont]OOZ62924.1 hypothetical protein BOW44_00100 [Solemya velum gill symbiont]OOZ65466.1 hypothetical protein BOW45_01340 [Solemya velum gill symbiont]
MKINQAWSQLDDEVMLTTEQLAELFCVSVSFLNKARMVEGRGPRYAKLGQGVIRYQMKDVRQWREEMMRTHTRTGFYIDGNELEPDAEDIIEWLQE